MAREPAPTPTRTTGGASPYSASARPAWVSGSWWCDLVAGPGGRLDPPDQDLPGLGPGDGVDQHHQRRLGDVDGQLGGELVAGQDSGAGQAGVGGQPAGGVPADPVVTAQRVAVADDQDAGPGHRVSSSRTAPPGASRVIRSGICPMAWVEQLRQGS